MWEYSSGQKIIDDYYLQLFTHEMVLVRGKNNYLLIVTSWVT